MKIATRKMKAKRKKTPEWPDGPRMTRELAEARAVGDPTKAKYDGVAFLRTLKK